MRILFLSNLYPPNSLGGYELWCQEVAEELEQRGHTVRVITSRSPDGNQEQAYNQIMVHRILHPEVQSDLARTIYRILFERERVERENIREMEKIFDSFQPELAMIWGMWNIPKYVPAFVEQALPGKVFYYLCDYWLTMPNAYIQRWQEPSRHWISGLPKRWLGKHFLNRLTNEEQADLAIENPICVSYALRDKLAQAGLSMSHAKVIHGGVNPEEFSPHHATVERKNDDALRLIFLGRLVPEKGVHTAVRALGLISKDPDSRVTLDIIGKGDRDYETRLHALVKENHLERYVFFHDSIAHSEIPELLSRYDAMIFPSEWEEPFARTVLEAMAAGLVVIGTTTGGTGEILENRITGLTYPAGDYQALADQIKVLYGDDRLRTAIQNNCFGIIQRNFKLERMVDDIEQEILAPAGFSEGSLQVEPIESNQQL